MAVLQTVSRVLHILLRPIFHTGTFFLRQSAYDFCRCTEHERTGRNFGPLRDERFCADDALLPDHRAIENDRAHADQYFVTDATGMNDRRMPDSDIVPDDTWVIVSEVQDCVVLDI